MKKKFSFSKFKIGPRLKNQIPLSSISRPNRTHLFLWSIFAWLLTFYFSLKFGAVDNASFDMILELRFPRALVASSVGMGLAVAGAALQALFSNPLCEPYTLGISAGSALGAVIGISLGLSWNFSGLTGTAFLGGFFFASILYFILHRSENKSTQTLLLGGVILGFFGTSLVTLWISLSDSNGIQSTLVWIFGDLSRARLKGSILSTVGILCGVFFLWCEWRSLDALLVGEEEARALGIDLVKTQKHIILLTSLIVGITVSAGGMIGFVGLVIPHLARRWTGPLHFSLIPFCAVWGAIALTGADCLSRVIARPYELPVGVITALIGSPLLLWILLNQNPSRNNEL